MKLLLYEIKFKILISYTFRIIYIYIYNYSILTYSADLPEKRLYRSQLMCNRKFPSNRTFTFLETFLFDL